MTATSIARQNQVVQPPTEMSNKSLGRCEVITCKPSLFEVKARKDAVLTQTAKDSCQRHLALTPSFLDHRLKQPVVC